jgi:hypothetical protein
MAERVYRVYGYLTISVVKDIKATSEDDARKKAEDLSAPSLCWQCSSAGEGQSDVWELNEFDEVPDDCVKDVEEL